MVLVHSFANTLPFCSRSRFFVKLVGSQTGSATAPRTSSTSDCSPIAPSAGVPTECRRTPAQQLLWRDRGASFVRIELTKATVQLAQHITDKRPNPSQRMVRRHQRLGRCMRTAGPDPQMSPAYEPPPIRDKKVNQQILATARGFSADC